MATPDAQKAVHLFQLGRGSGRQPDSTTPYNPQSLPEMLTVGTQQLPPVISVAEVQCHLLVLGAFAKLREVVRSRALEEMHDQGGAWAVYVARAVHRFQVWASKPLDPTTGQLAHPPIDILLVWHTYLLVRHYSAHYG